MDSQGNAPVSSLAVVIAAAGGGKRMAEDRQRSGKTAPKQWLLLGGLPLVVHSFRFFDRMQGAGQIVVALDGESLKRPERTAFLSSSAGKIVRLVSGGPTRQESVWRALQALEPAPEIVLIHDAARPFPPPLAVERSIGEARAWGGAILARRVVETVKRVDSEGAVVETLPRNALWAAQTPQVFRWEVLIEAYRAAADDLECFTDDAGIFEANGGRVRIVESGLDNLKVTTPEDFDRAERLLKQRGSEPSGA